MREIPFQEVVPYLLPFQQYYFSSYDKNSEAVPSVSNYMIIITMESNVESKVV